MSYLWSGQAFSTKSPPIAWDLVCRPKKAGGLGFKESHNWNLAMLGKFIWDIANKSDNLWVKWVNHVYIKNKDWLSYSPGATSSWYWRQICKVKDLFRTGYSSNRWIFSNKDYTASSGYQWLRGDHLQVDWSEWVWNRLNIPKCSFITWLAVWKRLQTRDRLHKFGLADTECPLCQQCAESTQHLFFSCKYSQMCCNKLSAILSINFNSQDFKDFCRWIKKPVQGRFRAKAIQACYVALIYNIWMQRNGAIWNAMILHPDKMIEHIRKQMYWRITSIMPKKTSAADRDWFCNVFG